MKKKLVQKEEEQSNVKKSLLTNILVMTVKKPSKNCEILCKQLKKIFSPDCLSKLDMNPKMQDVIDVAEQLLVKRIVLISEKELKIACFPNGPTYTFLIEEYSNNFKNFPND